MAAAVVMAVVVLFVAIVIAAAVAVLAVVPVIVAVFGWEVSMELGCTHSSALTSRSVTTAPHPS